MGELIELLLKQDYERRISLLQSFPSKKLTPEDVVNLCEIENIYIDEHEFSSGINFWENEVMCIYNSTESISESSGIDRELFNEYGELFMSSILTNTREILEPYGIDDRKRQYLIINGIIPYLLREYSTARNTFDSLCSRLFNFTLGNKSLLIYM